MSMLQKWLRECYWWSVTRVTRFGWCHPTIYHPHTKPFLLYWQDLSCTSLVHNQWGYPYIGISNWKSDSIAILWVVQSFQSRSDSRVSVVRSFVRPFVIRVHQESSRSTLLINQLYSSIDFNHHSSFQL